jgi:hypothetical protein
MILLGFKKLRVGEKTFTLADEGVTYYPNQLGLEGFAGGSIKKYRLTKYGIYLCLGKKDELLFLGYTDKSLTEEGKILLGMVEPPVEITDERLNEAIEELKTQTETAERIALIEQARALGIKGVLQNMKDETLIAKINKATGAAKE